MRQFSLRDRLLDTAQFAIAVQHELDGGIGQGRRLLRDMRQHPVRRHLQLAGFVMQLAQQHGEQAGLAGTVGTGQADLVSGM